MREDQNSLRDALIKIGGCATHRKKKKRGKGMLSVKKTAQEDPLEQFAATARGGELLGTGTGAGTGAILGGLLGRRVGGGLLAPVLGAAGLGLLGKEVGRSAGEALGLRQLEAATGVPWELS